MHKMHENCIFRKMILPYNYVNFYVDEGIIFYDSACNRSCIKYEHRI